MKKKWSRKYDKCLRCGKCTYRHHGKGFCSPCYTREFLMVKSEYSPRLSWSRKHECCIKCSTTFIKHYSLGLCLYCYKKERLLISKENKS